MMTSLATDRLMFDPACNALIVLLFMMGVLVAMAVSVSCLPLSSDDRAKGAVLGPLTVITPFSCARLMFVPADRDLSVLLTRSGVPVVFTTAVLLPLQSGR